MSLAALRKPPFLETIFSTRTGMNHRLAVTVTSPSLRHLVLRFLTLSSHSLSLKSSCIPCQAVNRRFFTEPRSRLVTFLMDKVSLGQVFSEHFGFLCQFSFHRLLHTHLSSGAGTIGQLVADVPSGLSLPHPPPQEN
jgi:hypothetical protein